MGNIQNKLYLPLPGRLNPVIELPYDNDSHSIHTSPEGMAMFAQIIADAVINYQGQLLQSDDYANAFSRTKEHFTHISRN